MYRIPFRRSFLITITLQVLVIFCLPFFISDADAVNDYPEITSADVSKTTSQCNNFHRGPIYAQWIAVSSKPSTSDAQRLCTSRCQARYGVSRAYYWSYIQSEISPVTGLPTPMLSCCCNKDWATNVPPPPPPSPPPSIPGTSIPTTPYINPIGGSAANPEGTTNIHELIGKILKATLGLVGTVSLIVFVYGGFQWLLSRGEPGEVKKGLDTMLWAGIGLIVIFGSYAILQKVFEIIPQ